MKSLFFHKNIFDFLLIKKMNKDFLQSIFKFRDYDDKFGGVLDYEVRSVKDSIIEFTYENLNDDDIRILNDFKNSISDNILKLDSDIKMTILISDFFSLKNVNNVYYSRYIKLNFYK